MSYPRFTFYGFFYSNLMRLAHRFNWHHMQVSYPENDKMLWCHWCGARYVIKGPPYKHNLISTAAQCEAKSAPVLDTTKI